MYARRDVGHRENVQKIGWRPKGVTYLSIFRPKNIVPMYHSRKVVSAVGFCVGAPSFSLPGNRKDMANCESRGCPQVLDTLQGFPVAG